MCTRVCVCYCRYEVDFDLGSAKKVRHGSVVAVAEVIAHRTALSMGLEVCVGCALDVPVNLYGLGLKVVPNSWSLGWVEVKLAI